MPQALTSKSSASSTPSGFMCLVDLRTHKIYFHVQNYMTDFYNEIGMCLL